MAINGETMSYELKFDPKTIEHLGVKMYSTLPPALAELISNAYDADASSIRLKFHEQNGKPIAITVSDDGCGMSSDDIQSKFLVIGRNRRDDEGDKPSPKFGRLPTGKKGLGKLALFGLAKSITVSTVKDKKRNRFEMDWDDLLSSDKVYKPKSQLDDESVEYSDGTSITLRSLKRKSPFDLEGLANNLARIFIVDEDFKITLERSDGFVVEVTNERRYAQIEQEFVWKTGDLELAEYEHGEDIDFYLMTGLTPIKPSAGLRGVTIFSRGKLVNTPSFFSDSTSSHFYQYLTGWIKADFIDLLEEDVISTNRQSINWENEKMMELREWLKELIAKVGDSWREKRKDKKDKSFKDKTGIDKKKWFATLPESVAKSVETIVNTLSKDEGVDESFSPVVMSLHDIVPEYPNLHWRHLHPEIQEAARGGYESKNYHTAFAEAVKRYVNRTYEYTGIVVAKGDFDLMSKAFGGGGKNMLSVASGYKRENGAEFSPDTINGVENAQRYFSQGVISGGRNVVQHEEKIDLDKSELFTEKDCLDLLSLLSHLMSRIENAYNKKNAAGV